MNKILYTASVAKLNSIKTVKELEEVLRGYVYSFNKWQSSDFTSEDLLNYKLATLALKLFTAKSKKTLPNFIYEKIKQYQLNLLNFYVLTEELTVSYEKLIDLFEFDSVIFMPRRIDALQYLNNIVKEKPIHFNIDWELTYLSSFDNYSTDLNKKTQIYLAGLRYKLVNFPNQYQTIIESYLNYYSNSLCEATQNEIIDSITLLEQQTLALKELQCLTNSNT